jgi:ABC-type uncharacterized transport system involved in gliding motility auxiliary subunit
MKKSNLLLTGFNIIVFLIAVNIIVTFLPSYLIDITSGKIHSLSSVSIKTIKDLKDLVSVKVYLSEDLPPQLKPVSTDLKTVLGEMSRINPNRFQIKFIDPAKDEEGMKDVTNYGIQPLRFSSVKADKFEVQSGYFGLVMFYGDKKQILPVAGDVGNLEYFVTSGIKKLTSNSTATVALAEDSNQAQGEIQYLRTFLEKNYNVVEANLDGDVPLPEQANSLVVVGRRTKVDEKGLTKIRNWIKSGKGLIAFVDRVDVNANIKTQLLPETGLESVLSEYGITIEPKLLMDEAATIANFQSQNGAFITKYAYWPQIQTNNIDGKIPALSGISSLTLAWASPIDLSGSARMMFTSSNKAAVDDSMTDLSPITKKMNTSLEGNKYTLGAINTDNGVKLAVVGDSDLIKDSFVTNNQQNLLLPLNLVDYFSQDTSLMSIRSKILKNNPIIDVKDQTKVIVKWVNLLVPIVMLLIMAAVQIFFKARRNKSWNEAD